MVFHSAYILTVTCLGRPDVEFFHFLVKSALKTFGFWEEMLNLYKCLLHLSILDFKTLCSFYPSELLMRNDAFKDQSRKTCSCVCVPFMSFPNVMEQYEDTHQGHANATRAGIRTGI